MNFEENIDRDSIELKLQSNFKCNIEPTNPLRKNEYVNLHIIPKYKEQIKSDYEISDSVIGQLSLHFNLHYALHHFWIRVNIYDEEMNKIRIVALSTETYQQIVKYIHQYIDQLNSANIQFINFQDTEDGSTNGYYRIFNGFIFGCFYNLNTDEYVELAKPVKTPLQFSDIEDSVIKEQLDNYL